MASHKQGILDILGCEATRDSVGAALKKWNAVDFETEASSRGLCATAMRTFEEWDEHPQRQALLDVPPVQIIRVGDAPKRSTDETKSLQYPLSGIRVLDLTRILAGPVCGRTLADCDGSLIPWTCPSRRNLKSSSRSVASMTALLSSFQSTPSTRNRR